MSRSRYKPRRYWRSDWFEEKLKWRARRDDIATGVVRVRIYKDKWYDRRKEWENETFWARLRHIGQTNSPPPTITAETPWTIPGPRF